MNEWTYEELAKANAVLDMYMAIDLANEALTEEELKGAGG